MEDELSLSGMIERCVVREGSSQREADLRRLQDRATQRACVRHLLFKSPSQATSGVIVSLVAAMISGDAVA